MKKLTRRATVVTAITGAAVMFVGVGMAQATTFPGTYTAFPDPSTNLAYNLYGSETVQDIFGALTNGYTLNGLTYSVTEPSNGSVGSWNAVNPTNGGTYDSLTPVTGGDTFDRPNGSGDGRCLLSAAYNPSKDTCTLANGAVATLSKANPAFGGSLTVAQQEVSFSRSSSLPGYTNWAPDSPGGGVTGNADDLTYFPLAEDAVGVAEQTAGTGATVIGNFCTAALTAIYDDGTAQCTPGSNNVGDVIEKSVSGTNYPFVVTGVNRGVITTSEQVIPVLPQASSGTRQFFQTAINAGNSTFDASVVANETGSVAQEENNAANDLSTTDVNNALAKNSPSYSVPTTAPAIEIVPFSGAQLIEQNHGFVDNSTTGTGLSFPTINSLTLWNDSKGASAAPGTLQSDETPDITYNSSSVVGNFARYVYAVLPTSEVTFNNPSGESPLQKWLDQTLPTAKDTNGVNTPWGDFGFVPVTVSDNSADWVHTIWQN